ncbi:MAG: hypothetical protein ACI828_001533 [Flavobacteriales bacterium]|jgi:hypothetical protein
MKIILTCFLMQLILLASSCIYAQVGIGTTTPEASSALNIFSDSKGFLMPRLSTLERDDITLPASGLMIYNSTLKNIQLNIGNPSQPSWIGIKGQGGSMMDSVTQSDSISTTSTTDLLVPGMTVSPPSGTYLVLFNAQHNYDSSNPFFSSDQAVIDLATIYQTITDMPPGTPHGLIFGNGETLFPGVYDVSGATSIAATLTLDGGGDTDAVFVIRGSGAFTTGASSMVVLTNGASSNNIFWMSETTLSTGDSAIMKGTLISPAGAISLGANTNLEGRMFTQAGALSLGAGTTLTVPTGASPIDLGVLFPLAMFTSSGAIADTPPTTITGDVGTAIGAISISGTHFGLEYPAGTAAPPAPITTYSVYQNGVKVEHSSRTINSDNAAVSLQTMVTILTSGDAIEIHWKVDKDEALLGNRTLLLITSGD